MRDQQINQLSADERDAAVGRPHMRRALLEIAATPQEARVSVALDDSAMHRIPVSHFRMQEASVG